MQTWRLLSRLLLTTLIVVSIKSHLKSACLPPRDRHLPLGCVGSPAACRSPAPDTPRWTRNPTFQTCLQAAHPTPPPPPATGRSAQLPSKTVPWESRCMTFWPDKVIMLGKVFTRKGFYCCGSDITAMLISVLLTSHNCHLTLTTA